MDCRTAVIDVLEVQGLDLSIPDASVLLESLMSACNWLIDIAQKKEDFPCADEDTRKLDHHHWQGCVRGEYSIAQKRWRHFCPVWHTGQMIKALVFAYKVTGEQQLITAAESAAAFIANERVTDSNDEDFGLIKAFEDKTTASNISAILECLDGFFCLSRQTDDGKWADIAIDALEWVCSKAYIPGTGLFVDAYDIYDRQFISFSNQYPGRPLLDDGVLLTGYRLTGNPELKKIFLETADRLLMDEYPSGNWINYGPCNNKIRSIHPRHAYWWGLPMLDAFEETGNVKYLDCAIRCGQWYQKAMRKDGGFFRNTFEDFSTDSFDLATSGSAVSAIFFMELMKRTGELQFKDELYDALKFCMKMQFKKAIDLNLNGAILEKILPFDGSDANPYYLRTIGTIFFVQAATKAIDYGFCC